MKYLRCFVCAGEHQNYGMTVCAKRINVHLWNTHTHTHTLGMEYRALCMPGTALLLSNLGAQEQENKHSDHHKTHMNTLKLKSELGLVRWFSRFG